MNINKIDIKKRTIYIAISMVVVLMVVLYLITLIMPLDKFEQLQRKEAEKNMLRVSEVISNIQINLEITSRDWAFWDDSYAFVKNEYPDFESANLSDWVFENIGLNFILFMDNDGNYIYKKFYDIQNKKEVPFPKGFFEYFQPDSNFLKHDKIEVGNTGIINTDSGSLLVTSQPILKSDMSGPEAGSMIWGLYADEMIVQKLIKSVNVDIELINIKPQFGNLVSMDDNTLILLSKFEDSSKIFIENLDNKNVAGNMLFNDILGKPAFIIRSIMPREIYEQGQTQMNYLILLISAAIILVTTIFIIVMFNQIKYHETRLSYLAEHDELTGIPNRRFFEDMMIRAISKAKRGTKSFLIFLDIDNFKYINDTHGHHFGDKVLIGISSHIQENLRREDVFARFGGDEFIILVEQESIIKAINLAERLREYIKQYSIDIGPENFHFNVSMGLVSVEPNESVDKIISRADKAMYLAKENGKDQLAVL
jgi:diguanylate cyclase (GGDEF)-like protein